MFKIMSVVLAGLMLSACAVNQPAIDKMEKDQIENTLRSGSSNE